MKGFTLKEIYKETGVTRRAVQGYESVGLVTAIGKNKFGHLLYDENTLKQIRTIKFLQEVGFTVKEISKFSKSDKPTQREMLITKQTELNQRAKHLGELIKELEQLIKGYK